MGEATPDSDWLFGNDFCVQSFSMHCSGRFSGSKLAQGVEFAYSTLTLDTLDMAFLALKRTFFLPYPWHL
jgi:hypothetical protein